LINCKASMSPEMAVRVARATKTSPESWLYMQAKLDLWLAQQKPPKVQQLGNIALSS
jgi:addiction module HigA family antidote